VDCDVEEPNGGLYLKPSIISSREVGQLIPEVDPNRCDLCGRCAEVCQYNAVAVAGTRVLVFSEICHGCGSCTLNCRTGAITEVLDVIGTMERGRAQALEARDSTGQVEFAQGKLNIGEPMAVPIIRQLKEWVVPPDPGERLIVLDSPPGTSCPVVETMHGADYVLLVTEPTPFGLHDLRLALDVARSELGKPVGVVINRDGGTFAEVERFLLDESVPILMRIPLNRAIAETGSEGIALVDAHPEYLAPLASVYEAVRESVAHHTPEDLRS
jgi:MinD superfamily P-loop ATPase